MNEVLTLTTPNPPELARIGLLAVQSSPIYRHYAGDYFAFCEARGLPAADPATVSTWMKARLTDHSPASLVPMLAAVKKALRGAAHELTSAREASAFSEALRTIKAPKQATGKVRRSFILTPQEERAALERMTVRDKALFRFLMATGCRISEALAVKLADCELDGNMVRVPVFGKGAKAREVRIGTGLWTEITAVYAGRVWLFETSGGKAMTRDYAYRRISEAVKLATGKDFSPHGCRHTFATRAIQRTGKLKAVSEYLGHATTSITMDLYVHESLEDSELAAMYC